MTRVTLVAVATPQLCNHRDGIVITMQIPIGIAFAAWRSVLSTLFFAQQSPAYMHRCSPNITQRRNHTSSTSDPLPSSSLYNQAPMPCSNTILQTHRRALAFGFDCFGIYFQFFDYFFVLCLELYACMGKGYAYMYQTNIHIGYAPVIIHTPAV